MTTLYDINDLSETIDDLRETIAEQAAMVKRQRIAINKLLSAIRKVLDEGYVEAGGAYDLEEVYKAVSSASTMTGTEER
jgi:hypothetical protein